MRLSLQLIVFLFICLPAFSQGNNGLVAHWAFDGNANDISGHNLNGTVFGASPAAGYNNNPGTAYYFNGNGDHINVANNSLLNLDSFSICVLVKPMGFYSGTCQGNTIISRGLQYTSEDYYLDFDDNTYDGDCNTYTLSHEAFGGDAHSYSKPSSSTAWYSNSDTVILNTWHCVTLTYHQDSLRLYVGGTLRKTLYYPDNYTPSSGILGIGYHTSGQSYGYPYWFNGAIDDIRLYNRALSDAEALQYCDTVQQTYNEFPQSISSLTPVMPDILIYPNPTHDYINVQVNGANGISSIQLVNTLGQVINEAGTSSDFVNIKLNDLPVGIYFIKVTCDGKTIFRKVIKE